jgi:predicted short-subunit dehydrogenase-like oxidoreductase (DUF2520 family)
MKPDIALIGPGKVGCAISHRLYQAGYPITAVIGRHIERAIDACQFIGCPSDVATTDLTRASHARVILLAVPDDQIENVAATLHSKSNKLAGKTLIHFSGLHKASCMQVNRGPQTCTTMSIHPLLPFADRDLASQRLTGCPCALEGDEGNMALGTELITAFDGQPFLIKSDKKALYHAAACISSNFLVTLLSGAESLLAECGISKTEGLAILSPLLQATLDNVAKLGTEQGLTGPIVRGDILTVSKHIEALSQTSQELLNSYLILADQTVSLAESSTRLDDQSAQELHLFLQNKGLNSQKQ